MAEPHQLDLVHKAIKAGIGNIEFHSSAYDRVLESPTMRSFPPKRIRELLHQFVRDGNSLEVRDYKNRPEYIEQNPDYPYWYKAVIPVAEFPRGLFVEVIMLDDDPADPYVQIVSSHE